MTTSRNPSARRRTFSAFGDLGRMPSEYEIVTEGQNWTVRQHRTATFEQNPSSVGNLWFETYRENSPLQAPDWNSFRDPDMLTYRSYVARQAIAETRLQGVLDVHDEHGRDADLDRRSVALLAHMFTPSRFLHHGFQQVEAYVGMMAPSPYITSAACYSTADFLRRVTAVAYRTRQLEIAFPDFRRGTSDRRIWETHRAWQPARRAIEYALVSYDWGEAFTALNLVLAPTLDAVLLDCLGATAQEGGDDLTWWLTTMVAEDSRRRDDWARALVAHAVSQRPENQDVLAAWVRSWTVLADAAALELGDLLEELTSGGLLAEEVVRRSGLARARLVEGLVEVPSDP